LYVSNKRTLSIYSTDTKTTVASYDIEVDFDDEDSRIVSNLILTKKHLITFYRNGRIEWLNKYYPDLMEEEDITLKPFYLDKYFETNKNVRYSAYDGQFSKLFITFEDGCFGVLPKAA
jgi:hypothetical protein